MKFNLSYIYIFVFLFSCTQDMKIIKKPSKMEEPVPTYFSKGFALIYDNSVFESKIVDKKLNNGQNYVLHPFLKNNTLVSISNPFNSKSLTAKVRKTINYPSIYNIVITKKMADKLELDINNPYVEVLSIRENDKFIAKEASIFDEEKKVGDTVTVKGKKGEIVHITKGKLKGKIAFVKFPGSKFTPDQIPLADLNEAKKQGLKLKCQECGKVFTKKIGPRTVEVKCPKCGSLDVDVAEEVELDEGTKAEYEKFFNKAMKKFKIDSPSDLKSDEDKKKFYDYIDKNWEGDHEESFDHVKEFKVQSMRDALAQIWNVEEGKNPFKKEDDEKEVTKDGKTLTGKKAAKIDINPEVKD